MAIASQNEREIVEAAVTESNEQLTALDEQYLHQVVGVDQAIAEIKEALKALEKTLDERRFERASELGYEDIASGFVFLQRCIGGLHDTVNDQQKITQEICHQVGGQIKSIKYEDVAPFVERKLRSLKPNEKPNTLEISVGTKTHERLSGISEIRDTPIEHIVELIVASAMKDEERKWRIAEEQKPNHLSSIEKKEAYTCDEVREHLSAHERQDSERRKNLF